MSHSTWVETEQRASATVFLVPFLFCQLSVEKEHQLRSCVASAADKPLVV